MEIKGLRPMAVLRKRKIGEPPRKKWRWAVLPRHSEDSDSICICDRVLSVRIFQAYLKSVFEQADVNGDGFLDHTEFKVRQCCLSLHDMRGA